MNTQHHESLGAAAAKLSPSIGVAGVTLAGIQVQELLLWATLLYTIIMIAERLYRFYRDVKRDRKDD